ncbi:MAG: AAA family ATPase, partial [Candidatus Omnitrophica bacterium]|nr:AAA family ATPase [Candidatus Omnitrophota bacterium]
AAEIPPHSKEEDKRSDGTNDVGAVKSAIQRIGNGAKPKTGKMIHIVTDGQSGVGGQKEMVKLIGANRDIRIFGWGIGPGMKEAEDTYKPYGNWVSEMQELPQRVGEVLRRELNRPVIIDAAVTQAISVISAIILTLTLSVSLIAKILPVILLLPVMPFLGAGLGNGLSPNGNHNNDEWLDLSKLGPLEVAKSSSRGVIIASVFKINGVEIPAPLSPRFPLVPANVRNLQDMWDALRMPSRNNLLLYGESGLAKTTLCRYLGEVYKAYLRKKAAEITDPDLRKIAQARAESFRVRVLTFHENLRRSDITERRHYGETGEEKTGWTLSDMMDGAELGDWIVLSEINRANEDVWAEFNEPLETKSKALHQRVIKFSRNARFIATINPSKGEGKGIYEGKVMSGEFLNRFTNKLRISYLCEEEESEVLKYYGPAVEDSIIRALITLANKIREDYASNHGVVPFPVTTRSLIKIVRHLQMFPVDKARIRTLFWIKAYWLDDKIHNPSSRKLINDLLDAVGLCDLPRDPLEKSRIETVTIGGITQSYLVIGDARYALGRGRDEVPDTVIEEVQQNLIELEWILKDMLLGENILLVGEAGTGKNTLERYLAHLLNYNILISGMSGETKVSDLQTYRSFGEEEAGKTGDTATLVLGALTDTEQDWLVILDEANKAQAGVLVSFNDLLQDKVLRLPNGKELAITGKVFVNMNPNRPPYEVSDISFEFMDRFCIHTIKHLPKEQAQELCQNKYPAADGDFVQDVAGAFDAMHPLYSDGKLFEPVTMRNIESAIERGLLYSERAVDLVDLVLRAYNAMDGSEVKVIKKTLKDKGFERAVIPCSEELWRLRNEWEQDKPNEVKALELIETYIKINKLVGALSILEVMMQEVPERSWLYNLKAAVLKKQLGDNSEANKSLAEAFKAGAIVRMNNGRRYEIIRAEARFNRDKLSIAVEAKSITTSGAVFIITSGAQAIDKFISKESVDYKLSFNDEQEGLLIYEVPERKIMVTPDSGDIYLDNSL